MQKFKRVRPIYLSLLPWWYFWTNWRCKNTQFEKNAKIAKVGMQQKSYVSIGSNENSLLYWHPEGFYKIKWK